MSNPSDDLPQGARATAHGLPSYGMKPGDAWTGCEWVSPERYEQLRSTVMPFLPPLQPTQEEFADLAAEAGEARAEMEDDGLPYEDDPPSPGTAEEANFPNWRGSPFADYHPPEPPPAIYPPTAPTAEDRARADAEILGNGFVVDGRHVSPERVKVYQCSRPARILTMPTLVRQMLVHLDPDFVRGGLAETPDRVAKAWAEWTSGYGMDPGAILKAFEDGAQGCDEMVVVRNIPVYSKCEHHLADIFGTADIAYIPDGRIVGLSKLPRLVDVFARRLQVQERMTNQVADALMEHLKPRGCGVVIRARHMCMESRGIRQAGQHTVTSALRGVFKTDPACRSEFLSLTREK